MNNKVLKFMQKNYAWIIAIFSSLSIIVLNIFKFCEYLKGSVYFSYYGIDMNLYKFSDKGFIYQLCLSFLFMLAIFSLLYCFYQIADNIKNQKYIKSNISNVLIIIISNLVLIFSSSTKQTFMSVLCNFIELAAIETVSSYMIFRNKKDDQLYAESLCKGILNDIKKIPFILIILVFVIMFNTQILLMNKTNYRVIDNNKVIVYSNNDYYITLDCLISEKNLTIYKGTQAKINNTDVYSVYKKFDEVSLI